MHFLIPCLRERADRLKQGTTKLALEYSQHRLDTLHHRTRMVNLALQDSHSITQSFPTESERETFRRRFHAWKSRMLAFPHLESDRPGEDIINETHNMLSLFITRVERQRYRSILSSPLELGYLSLFWEPGYERVFADDLDGATLEDYLKSWEREENLEPEVKEMFVKMGRERVYTWGKKEE
jgi:hypothetical protein